MFKNAVLIILSAVYLCMPISFSWAEYTPTYDLYMDLGKKAVENNDTTNALKYFKKAQLIIPDSREPGVFINLLKRISDDRVDFLIPVDQNLETEKLDVFAEDPNNFVSRKLKVKNGVIVPEATKREEVEDEYVTKPSLKEIIFTPFTKKKQKFVVPVKELSDFDEKSEIYLDDELWARQPKTNIKIQLKKFLLFRGQNIEKYLVITPGFIEVERVDSNQINVRAVKRGTTFVHLWDDRGRWTFKVEVSLPVREQTFVSKEYEKEKYNEPFKATYTIDAGASYLGPAFNKTERKDLIVVQKLFLEGETPYGDFGSFLVFNKFEPSTEITGYGLGLYNGKILNWKDFTVQAFDTQKSFSPLSLSGQGFRGLLFETPLFERQLKATYLRGLTRRSFGFLTSGVQELKDSYIEGVRLTLFPDKENQYSFNFIRAFGNGRQDFLSEKVLSVQGQRRINKWFFDSELAFDEEKFAKTISSLYKKDKLRFSAKFRDIDDEFATTTILPANRGEIGAILGLDYQWKKMNISSTLDVYRDRFLANPSNRDGINLDFTSSVDVPAFKNDRLRMSLFYVDTSQELSPRKNLRMNSNYTKRFKVFGSRDLSVFVGSSYQRSRFDLSPASEYNRISLLTGFNFAIIRNLSYFANYETSWIEEKLSGDMLTPNVFNTGLSYAKKVFESLSGTAALNYRDEEKTEGRNSFLAGEDSLGINLGLSYRPNSNFELYIDGRARNIWAESADRDPYNEFDVRAGARIALDSPFVWNPKGFIDGYVFKDLNGNLEFDENESGVPYAKVHIGKKEVVANSKGRFVTEVKAKSVQVEMDLDALPQGFVFTTPSIVEVNIAAHKFSNVNFGISTESGIYGLVYVDLNGNDTPDEEDDYLSRVELVMDRDVTVGSDGDGAYYFRGISPGVHKVSLKLNSIPIKYLPKIKLENEVNVEEGTTYVLHFPLKLAEDQ